MLNRFYPVAMAAVLLAWPTEAIPAGQGVSQAGESPTVAGNPIDYETARFSRIADAVRIDERIVIDGKLDEAAWQLASPAENFIQFNPDPGMPATEGTDVYFLYDDDNLYVGAICYESAPDEIVVNELQKDFGSTNNDGIAFVLDTLNNRRSGFIFGTNPAGARYDSQTDNDGSAMNVNWDGVWEVQVTVEEDRWIAEFMIPFKTVRFTTARSQEWGLNLRRRVRRKNEDSHWSPLPRPYNATRTSMAGTLQGLEDLRQGRNLKVKPFAVGGFRQVRDQNTLSTDPDYDGGLDLKYGLTPSLTLDATYRTDFSQVEVDQQQVNLTRFSLFFPEKREFFIENSGVFSFGEPIRGRAGGAANIIPFFSRRIGLAGATLVPIVGGARVTGKVGGYDVGVLTMKTEAVGSLPSNTYTVGRLKRNFAQNSWVGGLFTNRDSTASGDFNRVFGVDTRIRLFRQWEISSYLLKSSTPGKSGSDQARQFETGWLGADFTITALYHETQQNFNPEVGFIRRRNTEKTSGDMSWRPRLEGSDRVRNLTFSARIDYFSDNAGEIETRDQTIGAGVAFSDGANLNLSATRTFDRLADDFALSGVTIPVGDYRYDTYSATFRSNASRMISGNVGYEFGGFWNGRRDSESFGVSIKPNPHLNFSLNFSRNHVRLADGEFDTNLLGTRILYTFTTKVLLNAFVQYNTDAHQFSSNVRFHIIHHPLSDFFIVFNEQRDSQTGEVLDRALILKLTHLFSF